MHGKIRIDSSITVQKDGIIVALILGGTCSFVKLLVGSK